MLSISGEVVENGIQWISMCPRTIQNRVKRQKWLTFHITLILTIENNRIANGKNTISNFLRSLHMHKKERKKEKWEEKQMNEKKCTQHTHTHTTACDVCLLFRAIETMKIVHDSYHTVFGYMYWLRFCIKFMQISSITTQNMSFSFFFSFFFFFIHVNIFSTTLTRYI